MTGACPRCSAPLNGPFCTACGLHINTPPPPPSPYAPPGYVPPHQPQPQMGYPPPPQQPQYGYPPPPQMMQPGVPYMGPGGVPYMMVQGPSNLPKKTWATVGGIMDIVVSSIYLLVGLLAAVGISGERGNDKGGAMMAVFLFICLGVAGIIFGVYSTRGRWGGALGGGILHSVLALLCFIGVGAVQAEKDRRTAYDVYDSYYRSNEDKGLEAAAGFLVLFALLSALTAIFCFIGIGGAKARARYDAHMRATGAF